MGYPLRSRWRSMLRMQGDHRNLIAGKDYPRTLQEFDKWFCTQQACVEYLQRVRWPSGFECPVCGTAKGWLTARGLRRCSACQRQTSVTAGTIFEGTRKPLKVWFQAMWHVTNQKYGANALGLKRIVGFGSYETAWTWLHKMRRAMVRPGREKLAGKVEIDEAYVGGTEQGVSGRKTQKKAIVAIAVEVLAPKGLGRMRMRRVQNVSANSLTPFICDVVEAGSIVQTDGWKSYDCLHQHGYIRDRTVVSSSGDPAHVAMPSVHRVVSLLKRWLLGTHQGAVSKKHLDYYLDEFTFRFNRRTSRARGLLFYRLIEQSLQTAPMPYKKIVGNCQ